MERLFYAIRWILRTQLLASGSIALLMLAFWGWPEARSAFLGGLAAFLPNIYFAIKFGRPHATRTAGQIVRSFYLGETIKLITTAAAFVLIFQLPEIKSIPLFIGFGSVLMVYWLALLLRVTE
ncbi:ATP synthase subunit I [Candidatus Methylocalor cossyra]|uniref:ATP synthase protein I n=1 Tax=Candidatus Methylocalor cossyra TaxID=3108543 RepID=A0ABM9NI80_9GAMM